MPKLSRKNLDCLQALEIEFFAYQLNAANYDC